MALAAWCGPEPVLLDYNSRLTRREAYHRAADATWPPHLFSQATT